MCTQDEFYDGELGTEVDESTPWVEYVIGQFSDYQLRSYLQRYISSHCDKEPNLKGFMRCGTGILPITPSPKAVFLCKDMLSDEDNARFSGLLDCHSPWACPHCSPREMAKKGADIACAIDALAAQDLWAFMVTFTLPHHTKMSAEDSFSILKATWRNFTKNSTKSIRNFNTHTKKDGTTVQYALKGDAAKQFKRELNIVHFVKVYEFTYGENGWHPHMHVLFWCHKSKWDLITKHQDPLLNLWWSSAKHAALKYWNQKYPDKKEENAKAVENYYTEARKNPANDTHRSVYISVDSKGRPVRQLSSSYISGFSGSMEKDKKRLWSANQELTRQPAKAAKEGHYMPFDLLMAALNAHNAKDFDTEKKFAGLFLEYAKYTRKKRRVDWSLSGIKKIIAQWKKTNAWVEVLKKKFAEKPTAWKIVCWFTKEQWSQICWIELTEHKFIKYDLLRLCRAPTIEEAFDAVYAYLLPLGIDIMANGEHPYQQNIENNIYETRMARELSA